MEKNILKGNTTTKYTDHKNKNTAINCISIHVSELHCFNSSTKKTVSLNPSFELSV